MDNDCSKRTERPTQVRSLLWANCPSLITQCSFFCHIVIFAARLVSRIANAKCWLCAIEGPPDEATLCGAGDNSDSVSLNWMHPLTCRVRIASFTASTVPRPSRL